VRYHVFILTFLKGLTLWWCVNNGEICCYINCVQDIFTNKSCVL